MGQARLLCRLDIGLLVHSQCVGNMISSEWSAQMGSERAGDYSCSSKEWRHPNDRGKRGYHDTTRLAYDMYLIRTYTDLTFYSWLRVTICFSYCAYYFLFFFVFPPEVTFHSRVIRRSLSCDHGLHCSEELMWEQQRLLLLLILLMMWLFTEANAAAPLSPLAFFFSEQRTPIPILLTTIPICGPRFAPLT